MRLALIGLGLAAFCFAPGVFADNTAAATATPAAPANATKITYKEAKAECLKQDATLKGKALRKCVHQKRNVASTK